MIKKTYKKVLGVALSLLLVLSILFIPNNVNAAPISISVEDFVEAGNNPGVTTAKGITYINTEGLNFFSFEPGEYMLADDIDITGYQIFTEKEGDYKFDLNGKTLTGSGITPVFYFVYGNVTVTNGTVTNTGGGASIALHDGNCLVENVICNGVLILASQKKDSNFVVNNVTTTGELLVRGEKTTATINSGSFSDDLNVAFTITEGASVVINDGTFTSPVSAIVSNYDFSRDPATMEPIILPPAKSIVINGGTFKSTGTDADTIGSLVLLGYENVTLNGGTFISENNALGAIVTALKTDNPKTELESLLGAGYKYNEDLTFAKKIVNNVATGEDQELTYTQSNVTIVKVESPSDNTDSTPASNNTPSKIIPPKTGDNTFIGYIIAIIKSLLSDIRAV